MKRSFAVCLGLLCLFIVPFAFAEGVDLYSADVPVASQSTEDRLQAEGPALGQVLIKMSGNTQITENPSVKARMEKADKLVQQFSYSPSKETPATPYILHVVFDADAIDHILRDDKIPTWGEDRPVILSWIELEEPNKPALVIDADTANPTQLLFKKYADERGLPLLIPIMDVTDMNQVTVNDIVTMSIPAIQTASKRYATDVLLIVRVLKDTDGYSIQAKMIKEDNQWSWNLKAKTQAEVISQLMNNITDTLAGRYASVVSNDVQTQFTLKITGIKEQNDLADVMQYIQHLSAVADVEPLNLANDEVLLSVSLRGALPAFVKAISGEHRLVAVPAASSDEMLVYQWNP